MNFLLRAFVATARAGEPADGRLVQHLLSNPSEDGGQWHMLVNVIEKYGVLPKKCCPDTLTAESSRRFNLIINNKVNCLLMLCLLIRTPVIYFLQVLYTITSYSVKILLRDNLREFVLRDQFDLPEVFVCVSIG